MTTGGGADRNRAASGPARHIPVLLQEAMAALAIRDGGSYLDATFGAGGYTRAILSRPSTSVLALDRDPRAVRDGSPLVQEAGGRLTLVEARFADLAHIAEREGVAPLDGVVADVGVSSMQFDEAERGFSFRNNGPLDMRMEGRGLSAADIVAEADEETLADIFYHYGEERASRRIARAIVKARQLGPIETTGRLAAIVERAAPGRPGDIHPATKSFQALRIAVNDELGQLVAALAGAERVLKPSGRLAIVSFHSLEDRIVKLFLADRSGRGETRSRRLPGEAVPPAPTFSCEGRQPVTPSAQEIDENPRARSAKLRFATRTDAPPRAIDESLARLARLPQRVKGRG